MTESATSLKIETPKNIDKIFSLECFKYNDMKELFKHIYAYLEKVGLKFEQIDQKLGNLPNTDGLSKAIKDLEKRLMEVDRRS